MPDISDWPWATLIDKLISFSALRFTIANDLLNRQLPGLR